ncbi:FAD-dependent pyridine nucleotide-disulphide oxidoreductase [Trichormus variabilis ATCC 29413]|uniref:FAD-dependent pyridine nucleotide-disulphide oxidoreductase n=3 Tax=Anabaena variabilis TaxID=264691 RepID=Q3M7Q3_TRIV2|nr:MULTISPECIES: NAD(P)/FAD-dependent oxidoreductase [Nostocaceae]ABA22983.1 FAD-dependent pyridine nucleotide-disulphide oxidoreductase [Trichormus variabilis ATCC 29413]MBC1216229.1 NAD(P)/FAD-dependent oxidoreductase [Trichormus variabilis ARAD]MBC1257876.1 NAD(P)/FAD-dependent oxidoreductase [Trichormus variabilis V5]MBC1266426.1 NAD(P)/FAD-dependent oxidoreductase [Trichormus variabilis FSR]MBC1302618.1 NAD(P)/FAD-dependent oxidoreductase [Trichormus variabilis N2B]
MQISKINISERLDHVYDAIIVGGGAGGLSAGIYLQRYRLSSLIIDKGKARSFWMQELHNYLGLPPDTPGRVLLQQGKKHYESLAGDFLTAYVEEVVDEGDTFAVRVKVGRQNSTYFVLHSKYLIAASGIIDHLPSLENMQNVFEYAGYNLHVCMVCDGYEMIDKQCGFFAGSEASIEEMVFNLSWFTPYITIFTHGLFTVSTELRSKLQQYGYRLVETPIKRFLGQNHHMSGVELVDGTVVELETGLISMGSRYHNTYLQRIDLELKGGNLVTDKMCRTSHPRIFAIGDLKVGLNQVVIAAGDGALAATQIWRDIRRSFGVRCWQENLISNI